MTSSCTVTFHSSPHSNSMSHFSPMELTFLKNSLLIFLKLQAYIQSVSASLFLENTGRVTRVSAAKSIKAFPDSLLSPKQSMFVWIHQWKSFRSPVKSRENRNSCVLDQDLIHKLIVFFDSQPKSSSSTDVSMDPNGRVTVISRLDVLQTEWKTGKTFTCEVFDRFLNKRITKDISIKSVFNPPTVRIVEPTAAEVSMSDTLTLTCLVSGYFPSTITVHWKENGQKLSSSRYVNGPSLKDPDSSSYSMSSRLNVSQMNDKKSTYTCVVRHESSKTPFESSIKDVFASVIHSEPSAVLLQGSNELVCLVFGFSPASINITWIRDGNTELWNYNNSHPYRGPDGKFSIQSFLHLSPVDSLPGVNLTCRVTHGNTTLSVNVSRTDKVEHCHFFDDILHADMSQDTVMQAWGVAIFFLLLFFISVIFSAVITTFKIK
ncbi:hypothetical protein OJAV_G00076870 [Oryzias javanicus]|uniref:Ig-like domain-containing protein n=1 Tax=Oryzias javanicus TaxID=123683 RepID=A0A437D3C2_ORYJA|nr:hypothetical protein OJAV_G00076870 [Oryzias javanicus]